MEKRYSNGLYMLGNYQFSKNLDNNSGEVEANDTAFRTNKRLDRGPARYDQTHRAVVDYGYELPPGSGKKGLAHAGAASYILGHWQVQGILTLLSGFPFTPTGPPVCSCGSYVPQRVDAVKPGFGNISDHNVNHWFDVSAFALPLNGFQGNAGRNVIRGPGLRVFDFSLLKNFPVT